MSFELIKEDSKARLGKLKTAHGVLETPFFMPVATKASVKLITNEELEKIGYRCFISNGFILSLKPGLDVLGRAGGLHRFMNWKHPIFTDSGGFQLLSDSLHIKTIEKGIYFRNPFTKSKCFLRPEDSVRIQNRIGSDVAMCLDIVPKANQGKNVYEEAVARTHRWAERCRKAHKNRKQLLFGINQGGTFKELRKESMDGLLEIGFDGISLGGLSIGEAKEDMYSTVAYCRKMIPKELPVYLMGLGSAMEILEAIDRGVDIFDSNFPTRGGRHGLVITSKGNLNIDCSDYKNDFSAIDDECDCYVCKNHSKAYIHHLFRTKEENGLKHISYHNIYFLQKLIEKARSAIKEKKFGKLKKGFSKKFRVKESIDLIQ